MNRPPNTYLQKTFLSGKRYTKIKKLTIQNASFKVTVLNCIEEKPTNISLMIIEEGDKKEGEENE